MYIMTRPLLQVQIHLPARIEKEKCFYYLDELFQAKEKIEESTDKETFLCCKELLGKSGVSLIPFETYKLQYNNIVEKNSFDSIIKWR